MYGKHQFLWAESVSRIARAKASYTERLEAERRHLKMKILDTEIHSSSPCLPEGWTCQESTMPRHRFNFK